MKRVLFLAALVLGGCAKPLTPDRATAIVQNSPEWELCYVAVRGGGNPVLRTAVYEDIARRQIDCNQHMPMVMARMQQDGIDRANAAAQAQLGLQLMNAARPRPAIMPTTNCRSVVNGNVVNTICN